MVCGYSEGGPMAMMLAAMHPERVHSLVLYGTYARRTWAEDYPWAQTQEDREAYATRLVDRWDWEADLRMRCPSGDARHGSCGGRAVCVRRRPPGPSARSWT